MNDAIKELRDGRAGAIGCWAADEIEALRVELAQWKKNAAESMRDFTESDVENRALRAALEKLRGISGGANVGAFKDIDLIATEALAGAADQPAVARPITREWLDRKLATVDDSAVGAGVARRESGFWWLIELGSPSDERLADIIRQGESFHRWNGDSESAEMLVCLFQLQRLRSAATAAFVSYQAMPDGPLGHGLTNGHFFALRDALTSPTVPTPDAQVKL